MKDLEKARKMLQEGGFTCVICKGDAVYTSLERGVKPLVSWYAEGECFEGFSAADKVIGRATAFLYLLLGIKNIYTAVISRPALALLESEGVLVAFDTLTDNIINRKGDGICPFEEAVLEISDRDAAYIAIRKKMSDMNIDI